jgi:hypothetical protein
VHLHKDDILLACDELAGTTERQKPSWLSKYQLATKQLYDALEEEDVKELHQKADEWNRYGQSEDIQLEYAHICDFSKLLLTPASGCLGSMPLAMWTVSLRACVTLRMITQGRSDPGESNPPRSQAAGHAGGSGVRGR